MALSELADANLYVSLLDMAFIQALRNFSPAAIPALADRIIAATARSLDLPLITAESVIAESKLIKIIM